MLSRFVLMMAAFAMVAGAQKGGGGTTGPCGKDEICAEVTIEGTAPGVSVTGDTGTGVSIYTDDHIQPGSCVLAEYRTRYKYLQLNVSRDAVAGCSGARAINVSFPDSVCQYLTSAEGGYGTSDPSYTAHAGGGCSLELRGQVVNALVRIAGFVPDALSPQVGDVYIPFNNPHYGETGVTYSSFALRLAVPPVAEPFGMNTTKVSYTGQGILETYVNGRLTTKKNKTIEGFTLTLYLKLFQ